MSRHSMRLTGLLFLVTACTTEYGTVGKAPTEPHLAKSTVTDPSATFMFPLADAGLSVRSDGLYPSGTYSLYANGVCGVDAKIFATTEYSNSGDAIMQTNNPRYSDRKCPSYPRTLRFTYSDGVTDAGAVFVNVRQVQNTTVSIAVGETVTRGLSIQTPRCEQLLWASVRQGIPVSGDSVLVERVATDTWHVYSQPAPGDRAYCAATGESFNMPVDFVIKTSRPLP